MAGRRNASIEKPKTISDTTYIAITLGALLIMFIVFLMMFGVDLGFMQINGKFSLNRNMVMGAVIICLVISYCIDLVYVRSIRSLYKKKTEPALYIPFFGFISLYKGWMKWTSIILTTIIAVIVLISFTPLSALMPAMYLFEYSSSSVPFMILLTVGMIIIRAIFCLQAKKLAMDVYKRQINSSYGFGGVASYASYFIYFLPIIRCVSLYTDANFNKSLRASLDDKMKREE